MRLAKHSTTKFAAVFTLFAASGVAAGRSSTAGPTLPNFVLRTHDNKPVRFYDDLIKGKTVVISFMFTSCKAICPMTNANLLKVQRALGDHVGRDVFFYSLSLDPKADTPAVLSKYARSIGAGPGWTFLTGKPEDLESLRRTLGLFDPDPKVDADKTQHGALIVYGNDATGKWSVLPSLGNAERIANAVRRLLGAGASTQAQGVGQALPPANPNPSRDR
jgi:protein SCO1/2